MPRAVIWYGVYCCLQVLLNLVLFVVSILFVLRNQEYANEYVSSGLVLAVGLFCAPASLLVGGFNVWLLSRPRHPKAWSMHLGNIAVGAGTCVLTPIAVPLLLAWFRPVVRHWYQR